MYTDIPNNHLSSNAGLFAQAHRLHAYADIPNNDFDRPTLDYLRI